MPTVAEPSPTAAATRLPDRARTSLPWNRWPPVDCMRPRIAVLDVATRLNSLLQTVRGAILAPAPCAGCPDGRAEQDWQSNPMGQAAGFCAHCAERRRLAEMVSEQ